MLYYVFMFLLELIIFLNNYYNLRCWNSTHPHHQLKYNKNSLGIYVLICIAIYIVAPLVLPIATHEVGVDSSDSELSTSEKDYREKSLALSRESGLLGDEKRIHGRLLSHK